MEINNLCVVALTWSLQDTLGEELDRLDQPVEFMVGGEDLFAKIELAMQGHQSGDELMLQLEPEEAFGDYNEMLVFLEPRAEFPAELEEGMTLEGKALPAGCSEASRLDLLYTVTEIYPQHVVLDGNHPLAGIALRLKLQIAAVREASAEEISKGTCGTGFYVTMHEPA
jgi:FKBP-type peptidyl-prolyl cis-trans isomerase SlyD